MDKTELIDETLEERFHHAVRKIVLGEGGLSVNDWDTIQAYASYKLLEIDLEDRASKGLLVPFG